MNRTMLIRMKTLNCALFFAVWTIILGSASGWPLTIQFFGMIAFLLALSVLLYVYLKDFLDEMSNRASGLFKRNLFVFVFIGVGLSLLTAVILINIGPEVTPLDIGVWVTAAFVAALFNGIFVYGFNKAVMVFLEKRNSLNS